MRLIILILFLLFLTGCSNIQTEVPLNSVHENVSCNKTISLQVGTSIGQNTAGRMVYEWWCVNDTLYSRMTKNIIIAKVN